MTSDGTWSYSWEHGRELASMSNGSTTWSYTYDADGMRTKRTNGSTTYNYVYNGGSLVKMTVGSDTLHFAYEASGRPLAVIYNGTRYHYVTNLQGDVVQIRQGTTPVVTYTYDAWGNLLTISGDLASTLGTHNPLRYRGYVYDTETQLYYLQSRYYSPALGRFLNADAFTSTGQGLLGNNMFAYCLNNPVAFEDISGTASKSCLHESTEPHLPWQDSGGGGGRPYKNYSSGSNYYGEVSDKFYTVKFMNAAGNGIKKGTKYLWSACVNGYNTQQNAQWQEGMLMINAMIAVYEFAEETDVIAVGKVGYHSAKAAEEGRKALAYWAAPIPTPIDEVLAVGHAVKGLYHLFKSLQEVFA